ncbi:CD99 molecule isoform X1 [Micropterus salmoides]|uniref:CD99 molecule isoform X1 n=1 Tax=Micropterus salmoides TaxID=27706 RepID=UPI0018EE1235|nr:CD99 molecule isoform X1 [Micropterus salmoides]
MRLCLSASVLLLFLVSGTLTQGFDLSDAVDDVTQKPKEITKAPEKPKADGELDLSDAFGPDEVTTKAPKKPSSGGSDGGTFDDKDLFDIGGGGDYKPDGGRSGGRAVDPGHDPQGGADQPQAESGKIAGIASAIGVALLGAASSYFAYQKKKLCFKLQGGADPESGKEQHGTQSDPQVFSNLLKSS